MNPIICSKLCKRQSFTGVLSNFDQHHYQCCLNFLFINKKKSHFLIAAARIPQLSIDKVSTFLLNNAQECRNQKTQHIKFDHTRNKRPKTKPIKITNHQNHIHESTQNTVNQQISSFTSAKIHQKLKKKKNQSQSNQTQSEYNLQNQKQIKEDKNEKGELGR